MNHRDAEAESQARRVARFNRGRGLPPINVVPGVFNKDSTFYSKKLKINLTHARLSPLFRQQGLDARGL